MKKSIDVVATCYRADFRRTTMATSWFQGSLFHEVVFPQCLQFPSLPPMLTKSSTVPLFVQNFVNTKDIRKTKLRSSNLAR